MHGRECYGGSGSYIKSMVMFKGGCRYVYLREFEYLMHRIRRFYRIFQYVNMNYRISWVSRLKVP